MLTEVKSTQSPRLRPESRICLTGRETRRDGSLYKLAAVELALDRVGIPVAVQQSEARNAISDAREMKSQADFELYVAKIIARAGLPLNPTGCRNATINIWRIVHAHRT